MNGSHSVLHFTNSALWGGVEEHICGLLRNLSRRLFRGHLVCTPALYERFRSRCPSDVQITPLSLHGPGDLGAAADLARLIVRERFEILHSHMFWSSLCASPIAWTCRVPAIIETLHGSEAWRTGWKAKFWVDRMINPLISKHVAVSASDAQFLVSKKHIAVHKIAIIHNGVDLNRFHPSPSARKTMREALGFAEQDVVLIVVARFHPGKGHPILLEAMRKLVDRRARLKLICLGEGDGETEVRRLCNELNLAGHVRIEGYQPNVAEWLQAADINVLPTYYEGLPLTILEAMAARIPTVASHVGGIPELVDQGVSGLLVPPGDSNKLADALSTLAADPELRKHMGEAAYLRASQFFSLEQQVRQTERLYLELCGTAVASSLAKCSMNNQF